MNNFGQSSSSGWVLYALTLFSIIGINTSAYALEYFSLDFPTLESCQSYIPYTDECEYEEIDAPCSQATKGYTLSGSIYEQPGAPESCNDTTPPPPIPSTFCEIENAKAITECELEGKVLTDFVCDDRMRVVNIKVCEDDPRVCAQYTTNCNNLCQLTEVETLDCKTGSCICMKPDFNYNYITETGDDIPDVVNAINNEHQTLNELLKAEITIGHQLSLIAGSNQNLTNAVNKNTTDITKALSNLPTGSGGGDVTVDTSALESKLDEIVIENKKFNKPIDNVKTETEIVTDYQTRLNNVPVMQMVSQFDNLNFNGGGCNFQDSSINLWGQVIPIGFSFLCVEFVNNLNILSSVFLFFFGIISVRIVLSA